jgi:hypothetical protein
MLLRDHPLLNHRGIPSWPPSGRGQVAWTILDQTVKSGFSGRCSSPTFYQPTGVSCTSNMKSRRILVAY